MTEEKARELLRRMHQVGCPTYRDNSGARSRDGCAICVFCDSNIELGEPHAPTCLWLEVEAFVASDRQEGKVVRCR